MIMSEHPKPIPVPQPESEFYWNKAKVGELWLRHCMACEETYFYPRDICPACFSRETVWIRSAGKGVLHTFSIVHRAPHPAFKGDVPYVVALVEVEGGARIPTNLIGVEATPEIIKIGMPVEVVFDQLTEDIFLPKFQPVKS